MPAFVFDAYGSSNRWDVMGATAFGFRSIWVKSEKLLDEYLHDPPLMTLPDLRRLPRFAS
jgi:2-haloacid dehalogenase